MEQALGAHPVGVEGGPHQRAVGDELLEWLDLPLPLLSEQGHPGVHHVEVGAVGMLEVPVHAQGEHDAAVTVAGQTEGEVQRPHLQFLVERFQKDGPVLGICRCPIDVIDVGFHAGEPAVHAVVLRIRKRNRVRNHDRDPSRGSASLSRQHSNWNDKIVKSYQ